MVVIFNNDVFEELARIDNTITISSYSLESIPGDNFHPSVLIDPDASSDSKISKNKTNLLGTWEKDSNKFKVCLDLVAEDFVEFDNTSSPINIIRFYTKDETIDKNITAFVLVNPADPNQIPGTSIDPGLIYPAEIELAIGKNLITIVFPDSTRATVVSANEDKIERFLSSPSPDTGSNMFKLTAGGEVTVTNESFYKYFGDSLTNFDVEALPLVVNDTTYLDRFGRKVTDDYTYRIYKSINFFATGLDYVCWVPTVFGLYVNYDNYNQGKIKLLGLADFEEYHVLDGETKLVGRGKEAIESIPGVKFEEVDNSGLEYNIDYNSQTLNYIKPEGEPNYNDSATLIAVIKNSDGSEIKSEKVRFYLGTKDKEWELKEKTTNYFEPVSEGDYVENIPVFLFTYQKSAIEKDKTTKKQVKVNIHSFVINTSMYIEKSDDIKLTLQNDKLSEYFSIDWKIKRYYDNRNKFKNTVITVTLQAKQENKDNFNWNPLNSKNESELMLATLTYEYYNTKFYLVQSPKVDGLNLYEFNSVGANFSKVSSIEFSSVESERIYWMMTESKTRPSVMPFWKTVLTPRNEAAGIEVIGEEYKKKTTFIDVNPNPEDIVTTSNYGKYSILEKRAFRPDVEMTDCATGFYDVTDVEMLQGPRYVTVLDQLAIDENGYIIIGTSMVVSGESGDTQYNSSLRDNLDLKVVLTKGDLIHHPFTKVLSTYMINNSRQEDIANIKKTLVTSTDSNSSDNSSTASVNRAPAKNGLNTSTLDLIQNTSKTQVVSEQGVVPELLQTNTLTDGRLSSAGFGKSKFSEYYITNASVIGNYLNNVVDTKVSGLTGSVMSSSTTNTGDLIEEQQEDSVLAFVREDGSVGYTSKADGIAVKLVVDTDGKIITEPRQIWDNKVLRPVIVRIPEEASDVNDLVYDPITFYRVTEGELNDPEFNYENNTWRNMVRRAQITLEVRKEGQEPFIQIIGKIRNNDKKSRVFKNNRFIPKITRASSSEIEVTKIGREQLVVRSNCPFTLNFKYREGFGNSLAFDYIPKMMSSYTIADDLQTLYSEVYDSDYGKGIYFDVVEADDTGVVCDLVATYKDLTVSTTIKAVEFSGDTSVSLVDKDGNIANSAVDRLVIINKGLSKNIYVKSRRTAYNLYKSYIDLKDVTREDGTVDKEPIVLYNPNNARKASKIGNLRISEATPRFNSDGYINHALTLDLEGTTNMNFYPLSPMGRLSTLPYDSNNYYNTFGSNRGTDVYLYEQGMTPSIKVTGYPGSLGKDVATSEKTLEYISGQSNSKKYALSKYVASEGSSVFDRNINCNVPDPVHPEQLISISYIPVRWKYSDADILYTLPGIKSDTDVVGNLVYKDNGTEGQTTDNYRTIGLTDDLYSCTDYPQFWGELDTDLVVDGKVTVTIATKSIDSVNSTIGTKNRVRGKFTDTEYLGNFGEYAKQLNYSCTYNGAVQDNSTLPLPTKLFEQSTRGDGSFYFSKGSSSISKGDTLSGTYYSTKVVEYKVGNTNCRATYSIAREDPNERIRVKTKGLLYINYNNTTLFRTVEFFIADIDTVDENGDDITIEKYYLKLDENPEKFIYKRLDDTRFSEIDYKLETGIDPTTKFTVQTRYSLQYVKVDQNLVSSSPTKLYPIRKTVSGSEAIDLEYPDLSTIDTTTDAETAGKMYTSAYDVDVHKISETVTDQGVSVDLLKIHSIVGKEIQTTADGYRYEYTITVEPGQSLPDSLTRRYVGQIRIDSRVRGMFSENSLVAEELVRKYPKILPLYTSEGQSIFGKTRPMKGSNWVEGAEGTDYVYEATILPYTQKQLDSIVPSEYITIDFYQQKDNTISIMGNRAETAYGNEQRLFYLRYEVGAEEVNGEQLSEPLADERMRLVCSRVDDEGKEVSGDSNISISVENYNPNRTSSSSRAKPNVTLSFRPLYQSYYPAKPTVALGSIISEYNGVSKKENIKFDVFNGVWQHNSGQFVVDSNEYLEYDSTKDYLDQGISYYAWVIKSNSGQTLTDFYILIKSGTQEGELGDPTNSGSSGYRGLSTTNYIFPSYTVFIDSDNNVDLEGNYFTDISGHAIVGAEFDLNKGQNGQWKLLKSLGKGTGYTWKEEYEIYNEVLPFETHGANYGLVCATPSNTPKLYLGDYATKNTIKETVSGKLNYFDLFAGVFKLNSENNLSKSLKDFLVYMGNTNYFDRENYTEHAFFYRRKGSYVNVKPTFDKYIHVNKYRKGSGRQYAGFYGLVDWQYAQNLANNIFPIPIKVIKKPVSYYQENKWVYSGRTVRIEGRDYDEFLLYILDENDLLYHIDETYGKKLYVDLTQYCDSHGTNIASGDYDMLNEKDIFIEPAYYAFSDGDKMYPWDYESNVRNLIVGYGSTTENIFYGLDGEQKYLLVETPMEGDIVEDPSVPPIAGSGIELYPSAIKQYSVWFKFEYSNAGNYVGQNYSYLFETDLLNHVEVPTVASPILPTWKLLGNRSVNISDDDGYCIIQETSDEPYVINNVSYGIRYEGDSKYHALRVYNEIESKNSNVAKGSNDFSVVRTDDVTNDWNYEVISDDVSLSSEGDYINNLRIHFPENTTENDIDRSFTIMSKADNGTYHCTSLVLTQTSYLGTIYCSDSARFNSSGSYFSSDGESYFYFDTDIPSSELEYTIVGDNDAPTPIFSVGDSTDSVHGLDFNRYRLAIRLSRNTLNKIVTKTLRIVRNYSTYNTDTGKLIYKQKVIKEVKLLQGYRSLYITNPAYQQELYENTLDAINPIPKILTDGCIAGSFSDPLLVPAERSSHVNPISKVVYLMSMKFASCEPTGDSGFSSPIVTTGDDLFDWINVGGGLTYSWKLLDSNGANIDYVFSEHETQLIKSGTEEEATYPCLYNNYVTKASYVNLEITMLVTIKVRFAPEIGGDEFTYLVYMKKLGK